MRLLIFITTLLTIICDAHADKFKFSHSVNVKPLVDSPVDQKSTYEAGQEISASDKSPLWITSKGKIPLLIMPREEREQALEMQLPEVLMWPPVVVENEFEQKMVAILDDALQFQDHLRAREFSKAEKSLTRIQSRWESGYISFLEAQMYFLKGDLKRAKSSCERGLSKYPNNETGLKIMAILKGAGR